MDKVMCHPESTRELLLLIAVGVLAVPWLVWMGWGLIIKFADWMNFQ